MEAEQDVLCLTALNRHKGRSDTERDCHNVHAMPNQNKTNGFNCSPISL